MKFVRNILKGSKFYIGLILLFILSVAISPVDSKDNIVFLKIDNLMNILRQVSENGVLAVGMTLVILIGGIDLSVGSMMALSATFAAMLMMERTGQLSSHVAVIVSSLIFAILFYFIFSKILKKISFHQVISGLLGILIGTGVGFYAAEHIPSGFSVLMTFVSVLSLGLLLGGLNGVVVAKGKLQAFVVTLAMMSGALGFARLLSSGAARDIAFGEGGAPVGFEMLRERIGGVIPIPALIFILCVVIFHIVLTKTRFGRYLYAIGGNEEATRLSGISVDRIKIIVFAICSGLAGLAGLIHCAQNMQGNPNDGIGMELDAIAAVVIGGVSLMGGRGRVTGTLAGVLIIGILNNIMGLKNIDTNFQLILKGLIIVVAVLLQEQSHRFSRYFHKMKSS